MLNDSLNTSSSSRGSWSSGTGLVLSRTGLTFAVAGRRTLRLFCTTSAHCRGREALPRRMSSFQARKCRGDTGIFCSPGSIFMWIISFLVPSVITVVAVTVLFVISLLFTLNCSYLNPWSLNLVSPILLPHLPQRGGEKRGESSAGDVSASLTQLFKTGKTDLANMDQITQRSQSPKHVEFLHENLYLKKVSIHQCSSSKGYRSNRHPLTL